MVSFNGIGQWCATFLGEDITLGSVVKVSGAQTVAACAAGNVISSLTAVVSSAP